MKKLFTVLALMALCTGSAMAGQHKGGERHRGDYHEKLMKKLDLTDEQEKKIAEIREQKGKELDEKRKAVREAQEALHEAMGKDADEAALRSLFAKVQSAKADKASTRFEMALAIRAVMTPEQRAKFHELKSKKSEWHKEKRKSRKEKRKARKKKRKEKEDDDK